MSSLKIVAVAAFLAAISTATEGSLIAPHVHPVAPAVVAPAVRYAHVAPQNVHPFAAQVSTFTKGLSVFAAPYAAGVIPGPPAIVQRTIPAPVAHLGHVSPITPYAHLAPAPVAHLGPAPVPHFAPAPVPHFAPAPVAHLAPAPVPHLAPAPVAHLAPAPLPHFAPAPVAHLAPAPVAHLAPAPFPHVAPVSHVDVAAPVPHAHAYSGGLLAAPHFHARSVHAVAPGYPAPAPLLG